MAQIRTGRRSLVKDFVADGGPPGVSVGSGEPRSPPFVAIAYVAITMLSFLLVDNGIIKFVGVAMLATRVYSIVKMRAVSYSVWCMSAAVFSPLFAMAVRGEEPAALRSGNTPDDSNAVLQ